MRNIGYISHHGRPMGAVIYGKIYQFGGHVNKPVKKNSTLKPTHGAVVVISRIKPIEAGRAAYKRASFTFKNFQKKFIAYITLISFFNEILFYFYIVCQIHILLYI
jgi:hypothetical protein